MGTANAMSARSLQYYVIANRWKSNLEFFDFEVSFSHHLINNYIARLSDPLYVFKLREVRKALTKLEEDKEEVELLLTGQLKRAELMVEDVIPENAAELAVNQVKLEYLMANLTKEYRSLKKLLFRHIENVMKMAEQFPDLHAN